MKKTVNVVLAGLAFWAGLCWSPRPQLPWTPSGAVEAHSFEQRWSKRIGVYCKIGNVVFERCTLRTTLQEQLDNDARRRSLQTARWPDPRYRVQRRDNVEIWIRE